MTSFTSLPSAAAVTWQSSGQPPPTTTELRAPDGSVAAAQPLPSSSTASNVAASDSGASAATVKPQVPTPEQLGKIVSQLQSQISSAAADLQFSVDHDTGKSVVKVMDKSTNTVIWQFPSEQALQMSKDIARFQKGFMVNQQA